MVWYTLHFFPAVGASPVYATMVFAWSFTEIVRYSFYAVGLLGVRVPPLESLRYNTFYLLYPMGAGSEAWLIFKSAPWVPRLPLLTTERQQRLTPAKIDTRKQHLGRLDCMRLMLSALCGHQVRPFSLRWVSRDPRS